MNVKKPVDYSAMFAALDELIQKSLPQMELYLKIWRLTSARPEKGAAVVGCQETGARQTIRTPLGAFPKGALVW